MGDLGSERSGFVSRFGKRERDSAASTRRASSSSCPTSFSAPPIPRWWPAAIETSGISRTSALDLRYGMTSDLTLNATMQPDFGQVEADPATLNLSPFETFYRGEAPLLHRGEPLLPASRTSTLLLAPHRDGGRELAHPLRGQADREELGGVSVAALAASTDITQPGQAHNLSRTGTSSRATSWRASGRSSRGGRNRFNFMQTAVLSTGSRDPRRGRRARARPTRAGSTSTLNSKKRAVQHAGIHGRLDRRSGGLVVAIHALGRAALRYGRRARRSAARRQGAGRDHRPLGNGKLQINDMGYPRVAGRDLADAWTCSALQPGGEEQDVFNRGEFNFNVNRSWMYAGAKRLRRHRRASWPGRTGAAHPQYSNVETSTWLQFRSYREAWWGLRTTARGPPLRDARGSAHPEPHDLRRLGGRLERHPKELRS